MFELAPFRLFYDLDGEDLQVQFFYSPVSSTPRCTLLSRKRDVRFGEFDERQPKYEVKTSYDGAKAIETAKEHLAAVSRPS